MTPASWSDEVANDGTFRMDVQSARGSVATPAEIQRLGITFDFGDVGVAHLSPGEMEALRQQLQDLNEANTRALWKSYEHGPEPGQPHDPNAVWAMGRAMRNGTAGSQWASTVLAGPVDEWLVQLKGELEGTETYANCSISWRVDRFTAAALILVALWDGDGLVGQVSNGVRMETRELYAAVSGWSKGMEIRQGRLGDAHRDFSSLRAFFCFLAQEVHEVYTHSATERKNQILQATDGADCDIVKWVMYEPRPAKIIEQLDKAGVGMILSHVEPWHIYESLPQGATNPLGRRLLGAVGITAVGEGAKAVHELGKLGVPAALIGEGDPIPSICATDAALYMGQDTRQVVVETEDPFQAVDL